MNEALKRLVWDRAENTCEYCRLPQSLDVLPFQIYHVVAEQHRRRTVSENLALSCLNDNLHKGPNIAGLDPDTGSLTRLYHPRQDIWEEHFAWVGPVLTGLTAIGRTTIDVLVINSLERLELRRLLIRAGLFPVVKPPHG
jgi:HNH endonuclease